MSLKIKILDNFMITSDKHNIILSEKKIGTEKSKNPGKEYWKDIKFFPNVESLCRGLMDEMAYRSNAVSWEGLINEMNSIKDEIKDAVYGVGKGDRG